MREIVHIQAGQCGNQIGAKVSYFVFRTSNFERGHSGRHFVTPAHATTRKMKQLKSVSFINSLKYCLNCVQLTFYVFWSHFSGVGVVELLCIFRPFLLFVVIIMSIYLYFMTCQSIYVLYYCVERCKLVESRTQHVFGRLSIDT